MPETKRAMVRMFRLIAMMRENRYPNHTKFLQEMRRLDPAGAYSISRKTLQRDIEFLKSAYGAPIEYDYVEKGYYLTDPEWTHECLDLEPEEMKAYLLGARVAETILPAPLSGEIREVVDRQLMRNEKGLDEGVTLESFVVRVTSKGTVAPEVFGPIFRAWQAHRALRVLYRKIGYNNDREFTIEPHVLTMFDGCWYVKGKLIAVGDWDCASWGYPDTLLALPRIKRAEMLDTYFETDREMVKEVAEGNLFNLDDVRDVVLKVVGISAEYVREQFPPQDIESNADGSLTLRIPKSIRMTLVKWILGEGGNVTVLSPDSLAEEIAEKAKLIVRGHAKEEGTQNPKL